MVAAEPFGLYIHIPYCDAKCPYCDFNSHVVARLPEAEYAAALAQEINAAASGSLWAGRSLGSVFFGGGTPSLFAPPTIAALIERVRAAWPSDDAIEITLEANPGTVDLERLAGFRAAGVNRLSIGVQSFHADHLRTLGRIHSPEQAERAVIDARAAGFARVNLDLMFALPHQHVEAWQADLERACALGTTHVSAYNLTFEEGTPFHRWRREGRLSSLDDDTELAMFDAARTALAAHGLVAYEVSNFARPGDECRHNLNYWRAGEYLGVGAGAHSFSRTANPPFGRRWANVRGPAAYMQRVRGNGGATSSSEELDARQAAGEFAFLNLRLSEGFGEERFHTRFEQPFAAAFPHVGDLVADGLLAIEDARWRLTERGLRLADSVFASFL